MASSSTSSTTAWGNRRTRRSRTCRSGGGHLERNRCPTSSPTFGPGLPAVAGAEPPLVPTDQGEPVAGAALYGKYGCINCHGPNGLGGVPNPQSPDKAIPPLSGADFFSEFNTDAKIKEIIRTGSVLGSAPIVSMPHWGGILSDDQLNALVAYIKTLKTD